MTIDIDAVMYYRVADPQKATYSIQNLPYALETLTRTTLRNIVGEMELDQPIDAFATEIRRMFTTRSHRRCGAARAIVQALEADVADVLLLPQLPENVVFAIRKASHSNRTAHVGADGRILTVFSPMWSS